MGLDGKKEGNPAFKLQKENGSINPKGRAVDHKKPLDVKRRLTGRWRTHPVDKLVRIANFIEATNPEMSAKIWIRLLDSCEGEERKKKGSLPPVPDAKTSPSEIDADAVLKELEQDESIPPAESNRPSVAAGETLLQAEAGAEEDLSGNQAE
jgi:hypothetical protein